jgi:hypothetical protein
MPRLESIETLPECAQVVLICDAARSLSLHRRTFMKKLREANLPVVEFAHNWRGVRVSDLNRLIDAHLVPAGGTGARP